MSSKKLLVPAPTVSYQRPDRPEATTKSRMAQSVACHPDLGVHRDCPGTVEPILALSPQRCAALTRVSQARDDW